MRNISFFLVLLTLSFSNSTTTASDDLSIFGPEHFRQERTYTEFASSPSPHRIHDFALTDHRGRNLTLKSLRGKILVVNFFFARCPQVCPVLMRNLKAVNDAFRKDSRVQILSHSVDPEIDTVERLRLYAKNQQMSSRNWHLLTGNKSAIYDLAEHSYLAQLSQGNTENDFIHTETVVLVDSQQRIRGFYNGSRKKDMDWLIEDIKKLEERESPL